LAREEQESFAVATPIQVFKPYLIYRYEVSREGFRGSGSDWDESNGERED